MSQFECTSKPGEKPIFKSEDGCGLLVNAPPTWIRLPKSLGGAKSNIIENFTLKKCKCGGHPAKVQVLEGKYMVIECLRDGFMWMEKPDNMEEFKKKVGGC